MNALLNVVTKALPWLVATLFLAALTHFVAILILPRVATRDAFDRLAGRGPDNSMILLPQVAPGDRLVPFRDPETVQAICFYDLTKAPVRVKAHVGEGRPLTLSFRTREGRIFYAMTDRAALHDAIDIRLLTASQLEDVEANDDDEQGLPEELRLKSPTQKGLLVATALVERPGDRADAESRVKAIECKSEPLPP